MVHFTGVICHDGLVATLKPQHKITITNLHNHRGLFMFLWYAGHLLHREVKARNGSLKEKIHNGSFLRKQKSHNFLAMKRNDLVLYKNG